jgi:hypothetical protein
MLIATQRLLSRKKTLGLLDEMAALPPAGARSFYLSSGIPQAEVENTISGIPEQPDIPPEIAGLATGSKTGAVLFWGGERKCLIIPPFPVREKSIAQGYHVAPLRSLLKHDYEIALVLVRLGSYAIGLCKGDSLVSSKVGTGLVHARHKKGGSSQARFRRHREKQIESFLTRVCTHAREKLEAQSKTLNYIVYGGAWTAVLSLKKRCPFLQQFEDRILPPLSELPELRQAVLDRAVNLAWSSRITEWREED